MKLAKVINNDVFEVRHGVELTPVGMNLPVTLNEDQWNEIGDQVTRLENASNWIIGDWWAFGQHKYGSRKKWLAEQKARRVQVKSFQQLKICGSVCRAFERLRRRNLVSFEMHRELLGLKESEQDKFLDLIEAGEIKTHRELREKLGPSKAKRSKKISKKERDLNEQRAIEIFTTEFLNRFSDADQLTIIWALAKWTTPTKNPHGGIKSPPCNAITDELQARLGITKTITLK